eukprot:scaffold53_cov193-Pinguiococcus_pyrenoidosus.AAC.14
MKRTQNAQKKRRRALVRSRSRDARSPPDLVLWRCAAQMAMFGKVPPDFRFHVRAPGGEEPQTSLVEFVRARSGADATVVHFYNDG